MSSIEIVKHNELDAEIIRKINQAIFSVTNHLDKFEFNTAVSDLMKINIEGGEYPLLLHMASTNNLSLVNQYQIQFHTFIKNASSMRKKIITSLSESHHRTWCYTFVWENWKKK